MIDESRTPAFPMPWLGSGAKRAASTQRPETPALKFTHQLSSIPRTMYKKKSTVSICSFPYG